jgi:hypothetical protein
MGKMFIFFRASVVSLLGMDGRKFDIMYLLTGFNSLRIGIICSLIVIDWVIYNKLSSICFLARMMQKRLFEILEMNIMFLVSKSFLIARLYSFCGIPSIVLKTKACSWLGVFFCDSRCKVNIIVLDN